MKPTFLLSPPPFIAVLAAVIILFPNREAAGGAPPVEPGDDKARVIEALGPPSGKMGSDQFQILYFERGEVYLRHGVVERAELVSQREAETRRAAREKRRETVRLARERERLERLEEGEALRDEMLASESFLERPARERLAYWRTFSRHYPEVDIAFQVDLARTEFQEQLREEERLARREQERLALEHRTREAETRAARAEEAARQAEEERERALQRPRIIHGGSTYIIRPDHRGRRESPRGERGASPGNNAEPERPQWRAGVGGAVWQAPAAPETQSAPARTGKRSSSPSGVNVRFRN